MVGLQILDLAIGVRVPVSQPNRLQISDFRFESHLQPASPDGTLKLGLKTSTCMSQSIFI